MKNKTTKHLIAGALAVAFTAFITVMAYSYPGGITGRTLKGPEPGCTCHDPNPSSSVLVRIIGPSTLAPGQTATYTVKISGGPLVRGGTNIAVKEGSLDVGLSTDLQKLGDELTHTAPKAPDNDTVSFSFAYTAPLTPTTDTIFANGNSVNFDNTNSGDMWNFAVNKPVLVAVPEAIIGGNGKVTGYMLYQNYPNPFNPSTRIKYDIPQNGNVTLKIYDINGREVRTLVNGFRPQGTYEAEFNSAGLSSGIYYYRLSSGNYTRVMKMSLIK